MLRVNLLVTALLVVSLTMPAALAAADPEAEGLQLFFNHDYDAAVQKFHAYVDSHPADERGHFYLALCYERLQWLSSAREQYYWLITHCQDDAAVQMVKIRLMKLEDVNSSNRAFYYGMLESQGQCIADQADQDMFWARAERDAAVRCGINPAQADRQLAGKIYEIQRRKDQSLQQWRARSPEIQWWKYLATH